MPAQPWQPDRPDAIELLAGADIDEAALLAAGSNYVYLLTMTHPTAGTGYAVYKPKRGEAPLHDFPDGTLYRREYAAYLISEAIGWGLVPASAIREEGMPYGIGVVQLFIEHDPSQHYFNLREGRIDDMKRIALFDWVTNNADRKGGHTLLASDGRLWCIDQGLTFHVDDKLRTVIWDFQGQVVPQDMVEDVCRLGERLQMDQHLRSELLRYITAPELEKLQYRIELVERLRVYPPAPQYRPYPWPMI